MDKLPGDYVRLVGRSASGQSIFAARMPILLRCRTRVVGFGHDTHAAGLTDGDLPSARLGCCQGVVDGNLGVAPYFDQPFYVGYSVGGYELGLLPDADPADGALVYWGVDDVAEAVRDAVTTGAVEHTPASDVGDGIVTAAVRTPQGAVLGLIHNPHFQLP